MLQDPFFWAFLVTALILGWIVSGTHGVAKGLYKIITQLELERDAQARTIQWQRRVITELEREKEQVPNQETEIEKYFRHGRESKEQ